MKEVLNILKIVGDLEWVRCLSDDPSPPLRPPLLVWRFKVRDEDRDARIAACVGAYRGDVEWTIWKGERNWVIEPKDFREWGRHFRVDVEALHAYGAKYPERTKEAHADAIRLAAFVRSALIPN